ncbi:MAG: transcription-repair coupling factor [Pirellulales bacterium]|nr:transcription-repair coupling factor [Pirellulales bacterium]
MTTTRAEPAFVPAEQLYELAARLEAVEGFAEVVASLHRGHGATLDGVWGSSCALVAAALLRSSPGTLVVATPTAEEAVELEADLCLFSPQVAEPFPAWETLPEELTVGDDIFGERLRLLKRLAQTRRGEVEAPRLIVTSMAALLQPVPPVDLLAERTRRLVVGESLDVEDLLRWLLERGFRNMPAVQLPGELSTRGGIVDLYAPDWEHPVRVELFDDQIESIRSFDVARQRSLETLTVVELTALEPQGHAAAHLADHLPPSSWFLLVEPQELQEEGRRYRGRLDRPESCHTVEEVLQGVIRFPSVTAAAIATGSFETTCHIQVESIERFSGEIGRVRDELDTAAVGQRVILVSQTEAEARRLGEVFGSTQLAASGRLQLAIGRLRAGFRLVLDRIVLVSGGELFHRTEVARPTRRHLSRAIDSFLELREGDLVVHLAHGIGRYLGLRLLEKGDQVEEYLEIEFQEQSKIYVPTSKIELVQKYVGGTKARPTLARIGAKTWVRQKQQVQAAVVDLATEMLELQASRAARQGIAFPTDTEWQQEFDAAFPYSPTPDQDVAIEAVKRDMTTPRPMDRLICGDVGYGKTEVAMRGAFKAVDAGHQVAVLVPTTVLAEQHGRTFRARMAEFPFQIAVLSRFRSPREQAEILEGLAAGSIDVVIGTHRLVQHDVRFHNLGLVIIDEEQRFGVQVKERLKALRQIVDVLTLTATPIPRTLHMSLLGLRDISNLETAPVDRYAVETRVTRFEPGLVRQAVLRELNRGGQIFFVHNRVYDIEIIAHRLRDIVPEATIGIGHGQMNEHELERVMLDFVDHKFDILLATTIVESGLDIPNANTIFIHEASRYGLADLHQLRGRVGRYKHRAYCYLLLEPNESINSQAAKRLRAIEEFSHLGAGFSIALRDLEIRGAGNILGTEQSGHIATVGYELYCELLDQAVRRLKSLPPRETVDVDVDLPGQAYLPRSYVSDMRLKIDLYRRLARVSKQSELDDLASELADRFGARPAVVDRLLALMAIRIAAARWGIDSVHREDEYLVFTYRSRPAIEKLAAAARQLRIVDHRSAYWPLATEVLDPDELLSLCKSILQRS